MRTIWSAKKIQEAKRLMKKYTNLKDVANVLHVKRDSLGQALSRNNIRARSLLKPAVDSWWTEEKIEKALKIISEMTTLREAFAKMSVEFGRKISGDSLRGALLRSNRSGSLLKYLKPSPDARHCATIWTDKQVEDAIEILKKHQKVANAIKEMRRKFKIPVSYARLNVVIREKYGMTLGKFLQTGSINMTTDERIERLAQIIKNRSKKSKRVSFRSLCDEFDLSPSKMEGLINEAKALGYRIELDDAGLFLDRELNVEKIIQKVFVPKLSTSQFRVGVISDTHIGSTATLADELQHFITTAYNDFNVRTVLHCGDILAGNHVYKGQIAELDHWGCSKQVAAAAEILPKFKDLEYWGILGNHDVSFVKESGIDIKTLLEAARPDFHCIGSLTQKLNLNGVEVELAHLKSAAHARSYSLEKHVYRTFSNVNRPQVVFCGHRHTNGYFEVQNVHTFLVPCFEDINMFCQYNDFMPSIGGIIVDFYLDENNNIIRLSPNFFLYPRKTDSGVEIPV